MKIFIGYPSEYRPQALDIAQHLQGMGEDVWIDVDALAGGDEWDVERLEAQRKADFIIHVCSREIYTRRGPFVREIRETLRLLEDQPFRSNLALCIRVEDIRLPIELMSIHYIDMFKGDWRQQLDKAIEKRTAQVRGVVAAPHSRETVVTGRDGARKDMNVVEVSEKHKHLELEYAYPEYIEKDLYWRFVNSAVMSEVLTDYFEAKTTFADDRVASNLRPSWKEATATEFFRQNELVSIRIDIRWYGAGAAHSNQNISALNFLGQNCGRVNIEGLLGRDERCGRDLIKRCLDEISARITTADGSPRGTLATLDELQQNVWKHLAKFNFDSEGVTFNFDPYEVLAYSFGPQEVVVPWAILRDHIAIRYRPALQVLWINSADAKG